MCGKSSRLITKARSLLTDGDFDEAWRIISDLDYDDLLSIDRRIDCSLLKAEILMKKTHYQQAHPFVKSAFQESVENNLPDRIIKGLKLVTRCFFCLGLMDEWFVFFKQFNEEELVEKLPHRKQNEYLGTFYHCKGTICWMKGELTAAAKWLEKSLALREKLGDQKDIAYTINNLGLVYWYQGNLNQAMTFFKRSAQIKKRLGEKLALTRSLENIGIIYRQKGELKKA